MLAYTDGFEVLVRAYADLEGGRQISTNGGSRPIWSWDGKTLFFRRGPRGAEVVAVPMATGKEQVLFAGSYVQERYHSGYDVAPDGRFLMIKPSEDELAPPRITIVENWFSELRRRAPTR